MENWTDNELREELKALDDSDAEVTDWEAKFIQNIVYSYGGPLSTKERGQRDMAIAIIEKYGNG